MLNGSTLKICFLAIVFSLCFILIGLTLGAAVGKIPLDSYIHLLGILGIMSLFSSIAQAFIHANITEAAKPNINNIEAPNSFKTPTTTSGIPTTGPIVSLSLVFLGLMFLGGCASYSQKSFCLQLGTTNASIPYIGGATSGNGYACYLSCVGNKCPTPNGSDISSMMKAEIESSSNTIITSGPVRVTATPLK